MCAYFLKILRVCVCVYNQSAKISPESMKGGDNPGRVPPAVRIIEKGRRRYFCQMSIPRPYSVIPLLRQP